MYAVDTVCTVHLNLRHTLLVLVSGDGGLVFKEIQIGNLDMQYNLNIIVIKKYWPSMTKSP